MLNKTAQAAISAMSRLAEVYDGPKALTAGEIAEARGLPKPLVAKLLVVLSQKGFLVGTPGRNGGYSLAREPSQIPLADIASCFQQMKRPLGCPMGQEQCDAHEHCPLHDQIVELDGSMRRFLKENTLEGFRTKGTRRR